MPVNPELVKNGTDPVDFNYWETPTSGVSIDSGTFKAEYTSGLTQFLEQDCDIVFSEGYTLSYEVTANTGVVSGELLLSSAGSFGGITLDTAVGTHSVGLTATNISPTHDLMLTFYQLEVGDSINLNNISLKRIKTHSFTRAFNYITRLK